MARLLNCLTAASAAAGPRQLVSSVPASVGRSPGAGRAAGEGGARHELRVYTSRGHVTYCPCTGQIDYFSSAC